MRNVLNKICRENRNRKLTFHSFFRKSCRLGDNVEKYGGGKEAADDNIAARYMVDK
jgi:hypothetical protein